MCDSNKKSKLAHVAVANVLSRPAASLWAFGGALPGDVNTDIKWILQSPNPNVHREGIQFHEIVMLMLL